MTSWPRRTALTKDTDGDGTIDQYGLGTEAPIIRLAPFIWQNGGELVNNPLEPSRLGLDSAAAREAMQWFVDLQAVHHVVPDAVAEEAEDSESRFLNGRTAMFLQSRRIVPSVREVTFDWDVAPLPRRHGGRGRAPLGRLTAMPAAAQHPDAAWALIEFANSVEGQTIIARHRPHRAVAARGGPVRRRSWTRPRSRPQPGVARRASRSSGRCPCCRLAGHRGDRQRGARARLLRRGDGGRGDRRR